MTSTPPRTDPPLSGDEAAQAFGFLDYHRATLLLKTDGLTAEQLAQRLPPSTMTLGGLLKHMAFVEDHWFSRFLHGEEYAVPWRDVDRDADPDWEWHSAADDEPDELRRLLVHHIDRSRELVADVDLDSHARRRLPGADEPVTLRWIVLHMIEEYARHNGHADLLRESVDGVVGE